MKEDHRIDIYSDRGVHHMEISDVLSSDHGLYAIHADNSLGTLSTECQIEVLENTDTTKRLKVDGLFAYGSRYTENYSFFAQPFVISSFSHCSQSTDVQGTRVSDQTIESHRSRR